MRLNKKGFTLVELLVVIAVIALVLGITSFGIIKVLNNSKGRVLKLSEDGIISAGKVYGTEKISDNAYWRDVTNDENKYFCVTIEELINKGLLQKDGKLPDGIEKNNYVAVSKDKVTSSIGNGEIIPNDKIDNVCTGTISKEKLNYPSKTILNKYTNEVVYKINNATYVDGSNVSIKNTECLYGSSSGLLNKTGIVTGNTCKISNLKSDEIYYVRICQTTSKESYVCSTTDSVTTMNITNPIINISNDGITINYSSANISGSYTNYFTSSLAAQSNIDVFDENNNKTKTIDSGKEYHTTSNNVILTYKVHGNGIVYAKTMDSSNNTGESKKKFSIYKISFLQGLADKIDGGTSNKVNYCVTKEKGYCTLKAPTIERNNFEVVGWSTLITDTTSSWDVGTEKNINKNVAYYPIFTSYVTIKYNTNGGIVTRSTPSTNPTKFWQQTSTGIIQKSTSLNGTYADYYQKIKHNQSIGEQGLANYNNSSALEIKRDCYSVPKGSEWCLDVCKDDGKKFNQGNDTNYKSTAFCDTSKGNCTVTLYVNWNLNKYTISYSANGGSGAPANQTKNCGTNLTLSNTAPTKSCNTFNGWNTKSDGTGTSYSKGGTYSANADTTLYAKWSINTNTVSYNANGGSGAPANQTKNCGTNLTLSSTVPTKSCNTFNGWNTKSDGSGTSYSKGGTFSTDTDTTLYAKWSINTNTISYDANGGSGAPSNQTKNCGTNLTLSSTVPTRSGYVFKEWNTKSDGTGTKYSKGGTYSANANVTLYAQWTIITYNVHYNGNGNTGERYTASDSCNSSNKCGLSRYASGTTYENNVFKHTGTYTYNIDKTLQTNLFSRTGYTFKEWNTRSDGKGTGYADKESVKNLTSTNGATVTLYAIWSPKTISVTFHRNRTSSDSTVVETFTYGTSNQKFGYKTDGTGRYSTMSNASVGFGAWTRAGYTMLGWAKTSSATSADYSTYSGVSNNWIDSNSPSVNLYAVWKPITYKVYYNGNGHTSQTYNSSTSCNSDKTACGLNRFASGTTYSSPVFKHNGTYTYDSEKTLINNLFKKTGYSFNGWNTKSDGKGTSYGNKASVKNLTTTDGATVTLYAQWKDDIKPSITMSLSSSVSYCSGTAITLNCSDSGSGMKEAKMLDVATTTTGTSSTTQYFNTIRYGDRLTRVTCTDKDGNANSKDYYYTIVSCSSGGGSSSGCSTSYITCLGTAKDEDDCLNNKDGYHYGYGDCYKKVCATKCPSGWIKS